MLSPMTIGVAPCGRGDWPEVRRQAISPNIPNTNTPLGARAMAMNDLSL